MSRLKFPLLMGGTACTRSWVGCRTFGGAQRILKARSQASAAELAPHGAAAGRQTKDFEQHPAGEYAYYTSHKRPIEITRRTCRCRVVVLRKGQEDAGYIPEVDRQGLAL